MKIFITLCIACAIGLGSTFAADDEKKPGKGKKPRPILTEEQRALMKEIRGKHDENKDGKLSQEERAKISDEDKKRIKGAGIGPKKKGPAVSGELRALMKEITKKYDENEDGKLDKDERAKISDEDKKRVKDARIAGSKGKPKKIVAPKKEGGKKGKGGKKKDAVEE